MGNELKKKKENNSFPLSAQQPKLKTQNCILVSACLLGVNCRYNGIPLDKRELPFEESEMILICPEQSGDLKSPRKPCWFSNVKTGKGVLKGMTEIINEDGENHTLAFLKGADATLKTALENNVKKALLKERSPSCGCNQVYMGKEKIPGKGVTAALLEQHGIEVIGID